MYITYMRCKVFRVPAEEIVAILDKVWKNVLDIKGMNDDKLFVSAGTVIRMTDDRCL